MLRYMLVLAGLLARLASAVVGAGLLCWAAMIFDNIWGENDAGTGNYLFFAAVPAVPGLVLLALALLGLRPLRPLMSGGDRALDGNNSERR